MRSFWPLTLLAAALAAMIWVAPAAAQTNRTFTLQPEGRATVTFIAFCTEFGDKYPGQIQLPNALAGPKVRAALQYIADNGLANDPKQALQGQYAIWTVLAQPAPAGDAQAQQVAAFAQANTVAEPQGTSLLDAAQAGQVRLTLESWEPAGPVTQITATARDNFYGRGRLLVENVSGQELTLYMPVGTLFPPTVEAHQTMAGFLADVAVTNPVTVLPETSGSVLLPIAAALAAGVAAVRFVILRRGPRIDLRG
jgi:hypothetical protein